MPADSLQRNGRKSMMRQCLSVLVFAALISPVIAQNPSPTVSPRAALIPDGWQVEAEASGDLDADGRLDLALVLVGADVDLSIENKTLVGPRRLIIAFGAEGGYERVISNNQFISPTDDPDIEDVFDLLAISDGNLVVDLRLFAFVGGWSMWRKSFTFHWKNDAFALALFDWTDVNRATGELTITTAEYVADTITTRHGSISTDVETSETNELSNAGQIALDDIVDGLAFEP